MTRTEFVLATAVALFVAFAMGWLACWVMHRFVRAPASDLSELDRMAQALHDAEEARDEARARAEDAEGEREAALDAMEEARGEADALRAWIERTQAAKG